MAMVSLLFAGIYVIVVIAGAINLLIAATIFVVRFIKKRRNKKVGTLSKVVGIIFASMGTIAEIPLIIMLVMACVNEVGEKRYYESLDNKVLIGEKLEDEFEYNGETLVVVDEIENDPDSYDDEQKTKVVANLIFNDSDESYAYDEMEKVENNSGCDIYIVHSYRTLYYVKKEDKEKVIKYYQSEAECIAEVSYSHGDWVDAEIDLERIRDIAEKPKIKEKRAESDGMEKYDLEINTTDYIWGDNYSFGFFKDCVLFEYEYEDTDEDIDESTEGKQSSDVLEGYRLSEEDEKYIRKVFEKAVKAYN